MKNNKLNIRWIALVAALVILILLLTMCTGSCTGEKTEETLSAQPTSLPEETAAETAAPVTEAPTEERAAPTEETTEPTEETAKASVNSSSGSDVSAEDDEPEVEFDYDESEYINSKVEEDVEIPNPGTAENPYLEVLSGYPSDVTTVQIPAGKGINYLISGSAGSVVSIESAGAAAMVDGKTYKADESGMLTLDLTKISDDPVIKFSNTSAAEAAFVVNFLEALGGKSNPEMLTDLSEIHVSLDEGDSSGYYYQWNSGITGTVNLTVTEQLPEEPETETENGKTEETVGEEAGKSEETLPLEILVTVGEKTYKLSEVESGTLSFAVAKGELVLIQTLAVPGEDSQYPAVKARILGELEPDLGTMENPETLTSLDSVAVTLEEDKAEGYFYQWTASTDATVTLISENTDSEPNVEKTELELIVTLGENAYKLSECENGELSFRVSQNDLAVIQAMAKPDENGKHPAVNAKIAGTIAPDPGTPENPLALESIDVLTAVLEAGDANGLSYCWTAGQAGTVAFCPNGENVQYDVVLTGSVSGNTARLSESQDGQVSLALEKDEILTIQITALANDARAAMAMEASLEGSFVEAPGSSPENPIIVSDPMAALAVSVDAGETVYISGMFHEMIAAAENASGAAFIFGDETVTAGQSGMLTLEFPEAEEEAEALLFGISSAAEQAYVLTFAYPEGHERNPSALVMGANTAQLSRMDADSYFFRWTAECDGQLTITMDEKAHWQYAIDNLTAETYGEVHTSQDETMTASETVEVKAGEAIQIRVNTLNPEDPTSTPAGSVMLTASFFDPLLGTEAKPISLDAEESAVNVITVPGGQVLYYSAEAEGMLLTLTGTGIALDHDGVSYAPENGRLTLVCVGASSVFCIRNEGEAEQQAKLVFTYPLGHREKPDVLVLGENTAKLDEGSKTGYTYAWTADCTGELTITMEENAQWQYILSNETARTVGVVHTSADDPMQSSEMIRVTKGDRILVTVDTFDPENPLNPPAGEVSFVAVFVDPTLGKEENPIWLDLKGEITIPAGKTLYCTAKAHGMVMTLEGVYVTVTHNGTEYVPEQGRVKIPSAGTSVFDHPMFAITNTAAVDCTYAVSFEYPAGHFMNPVELKLEENTAKLEEGNKEGIWFSWTAEKTGSLTIAMETESGWQYGISNATTGVVADLHNSGEEESIAEETIAVKKGDEVRINVNTFDPESAVAPAGEVVFTASFQEHKPEPEPLETQPEVPSEQTNPDETQPETQPDEE